MPVVSFRGGPLNGERWDIPALMAGVEMTYRTETTEYNYAFSGQILDGARLYYLNGIPPKQLTPWPEPEGKRP